MMDKSSRKSKGDGKTESKQLISTCTYSKMFAASQGAPWNRCYRKQLDSQILYLQLCVLQIKQPSPVPCYVPNITLEMGLINTTCFMEQWLEGRGIKHKICSNIARSEEMRSTKQNKIKNWNSQNIYNLRKRTTHEKPFLLNNVFKEVASNVSSGSLPVGSAVLQKKMSSSENYWYRDKTQSGIYSFLKL